MKLTTFTKQPNEYLDYDIDYTEWLKPVEDTIDDVQITIECLTDPDDTSLECVSYEYTTSVLKLWIHGGTVDYRYKVTVLLTSVVGRKDESELIFKIKDF
jgi:hypothetical protein